MHRSHVRVGAVVAMLMMSAAGSQPVVGQDRVVDDWVVPRTADGRPDLQGVWSNNGTTPLERPTVFGERTELTDEEVALIRERTAELRTAENDAGANVFSDFLIRQIVGDCAPDRPCEFDTATGNYNAFWIADRTFDDRRTSLIFDPPNGRVPPLTPEAMARRTAANAAGRDGGPESMSLFERCITVGAPNLMTAYNSNLQILQTDSHVALVQELIHDARVIPVDGREDADARIRQWHGSSRGRWDGDTLVIETKHYSPQTSFVSLSAASPSAGAMSGNVTITERLSRADQDTLRYEVTFDDPTTWTKPWSVRVLMRRTTDSLYEYACHEGNYAMANILAGERMAEKEAAK